MGVSLIVMPPNVTVTAKFAATVPVCNVITMLDAPLAVEFAVAPPLNATEDGVTPAAKKPDGYVSVTVLGTASAPPAVGLKLNVTGTPARFTTRSAGPMVNKTEVTAPQITLDATPADAVVSASVCTLMPVSLPAVAAPIFRPFRVMVKAVVAATPTTAVVMTTALPEMTDVAVMLLTDVLAAALAAGLGVEAKNPAGYFSVIFPLVERAAWVVNTRVTGTLVLRAKRSPAAMVNVTAVV
jgi:hypothetical protein